MKFSHYRIAAQLSIVASIASGLAAIVYWANSLTQPYGSVPATLSVTTTEVSGPSSFQGTGSIGQYVKTNLPPEARPWSRAELIATLALLAVLFLAIHLQARRAGDGPLWSLVPGVSAKWITGSLISLGFLPQLAGWFGVHMIIDLGGDSGTVAPTPVVIDLGWIVAGLAYYALIRRIGTPWRGPDHGALATTVERVQ